MFYHLDTLELLHMSPLLRRGQKVPSWSNDKAHYEPTSGPTQPPSNHNKLHWAGLTFHTAWLWRTWREKWHFRMNISLHELSSGGWKCGMLQGFRAFTYLESLNLRTIHLDQSFPKIYAQPAWLILWEKGDLQSVSLGNTPHYTRFWRLTEHWSIKSPWDPCF